MGGLALEWPQCRRPGLRGHRRRAGDSNQVGPERNGERSGPQFNALTYVLAGSGTVGPNRRPIETKQFAVFGPGDALLPESAERLGSRSASPEVLLLGGVPIGEHVDHYGPFVMYTRTEIGQALEDFEAGRLGPIPPNALMPHVPDPAPIRTEQMGI